MLLLEHIEKNRSTTQLEISKVIDASLGMVNKYVDQLEEGSLLVREYKSAKVVDYIITAEGIKRKNYLQIRYIKELMDQYIKALDTARTFLSSIEEKEFKRVFLYGAGEVAEIILDILVANKFDLDVVGLIDDNELKQGSSVKGIMVYSIDALGSIDHDGVIITSYTFEEDIIAKLEDNHYPVSQIIRYFNMEEH
jgi:FlaA1/EpsC-like NDP-sugar epimerase